jgi:leader peptidase (prepilin peptidase)/N-methyltransferase
MSVAPVVGLIAFPGLAVGSFLNVVIHRVPRRESIVRPGSHCPECDSPIKNRHNVPVVSWLVLRGRCHSCESRISPRYPLVEGGTALLFVAVTARFGLSLQLPAFLYLAAVCIALATIDLDVRLLPDAIVLPSYVVTVVLLMPAGAADADWRSAVRALVGMAALLIVFFALALAYPNGLGFGDVKLAGLLGLSVGWLSWGALFLTAVGSLVIAALSGRAAVAAHRPTRNLAVPLGPCLVTAAVLTLFVTAPVADWYRSLITA